MSARYRFLVQFQAVSYFVAHWSTTLSDQLTNVSANFEIATVTCSQGGGGHCHMSTDIICLQYDPFFSQILHPMTPFSTTVHTQWPHFPLHSLNDLFFSKFQRKISFFSPALRAFQNFCQFSAEKGEFLLKFDKIYPEWPPILRSLRLGRPNFFEFHTKRSLFFYEILHRMTPVFVLR